MKVTEGVVFANRIRPRLTRQIVDTGIACCGSRERGFTSARYLCGPANGFLFVDRAKLAQAAAADLGEYR